MKNPQESRIISNLRVLMPILTVAISLVALYFAFIDRLEPGEMKATDSTMTITEAQAILDRANDALRGADLILAFLEGASVLAGIILVGAGILGVTTIQDLRRDTEAIKQEILDRLDQAEREMAERVESTQKELFAKVEHINALETELEEAIASNRERISEQVQDATKEAREAFVALSHHIMAQRLARENNIDAAIHACEEAHEIDPDNIPNNYLLGTLLIKKNELDEAIEHLTEAFEASKENGDDVNIPAQAALGLAIRRKGDMQEDTFQRNRYYNQAEQLLLDATSNDPQLLNEDNESYLGVLGSLYRRQGRTDDAIAVYLRAAEVTPRRSYPVINLAMLYLEAGEEELSQQHIETAQQLARRRLADTPEDYWGMHDNALATYLRGDIDEALTLFEEALEYTPSISVLDSVVARLLYLQRIAVETPRIEESIERFMKARKRFIPSD